MDLIALMYMLAAGVGIVCVLGFCAAFLTERRLTRRAAGESGRGITLVHFLGGLVIVGVLGIVMLASTLG